jgi:hypothetical protein
MFNKYLYFLLIFTGLSSCRKENTSWSTDWSFPLVKDVLNLQHLVGDTLLTQDSSGCFLTLKKNLYSLNLSEYLKIPDTTISSELSINFPSLNINPGTILSQTNVENQIGIGDAQLKYIVVKKGKIDISLKNPLATKTIYTIEIPCFTKDGVTVKKTLIAEKGSADNPSSVYSSLDLSGYQIDLSGLGSASYNTIITNFDMQLDPQGSITKVSNKDITKMDIQLSGIQIGYARGYFGNLSFSNKNEVKIAGFNAIQSGTLELSKAQVDFSISNGCKVMAKGHINSLVSQNSTSKKDVKFQNIQLENPFFISSASGNETNLIPSIKHFSLNETTSNILPFLSNFGNSYLIDYNFELNPYGNLSGGWDEFYPNSKISLDLSAKIPLKFKATNLTIQDTFPIHFNSTNTHKISAGKLKLLIENTFPIAGNIEISFLDVNHKTVEKIVGSSSILGTSSSQDEAIRSTIYFQPSFGFFTRINTIESIIIKVILDTSNKTVEVPYTSGISFQLIGDFQYNTGY